MGCHGVLKRIRKAVGEVMSVFLCEVMSVFLCEAMNDLYSFVSSG